MNYVDYQKSVGKIEFYSMNIPLTKFETIVSKNAGGDKFEAKTHASPQILDVGHCDFLPAAPMVIYDVGIFRKPVQRALQKFVLLPPSGP